MKIDTLSTSTRIHVGVDLGRGRDICAVIVSPAALAAYGGEAEIRRLTGADRVVVAHRIRQR